MGSRGPAPKNKEKQSIKFRPGVPDAPAWLDDDAATEYRRAASELEAADGALQQMDAMTLATYAQAVADVARLTLEIRKEGEVVALNNGMMAANPKVGVRQIAQRQLLASVGQLGFSPAARARVPKAAATGNPDNAFADLVK